MTDLIFNKSWMMFTRLIFTRLICISLVMMIGINLAWTQSIPQAKKKQLSFFEVSEIELKAFELSKNQNIRQKIKQAIEDQQWLTAAQLIDATHPQAVFIKAYLYAQSKGYDQALPLLKGLDQKLALMKDEIYLIEAQAIFYLYIDQDDASGLSRAELKAQYEKAFDWLEKISKDDFSIYTEKIRLEAILLRKLGQFDATKFDSAIGLYDWLLAQTPSSEHAPVYLGKALTLYEKKEYQQAIDLFKKLDINYPLSLSNGKAKEYVNLITAMKSAYLSTWQKRTIDDHLLKLSKIAEQKQFTTLQNELNALLDKIEIDSLNDDQKCLLYYYQGSALEKSKKLTDALKQLKKAQTYCAKNHIEQEAWVFFLAGRIASKLDLDDEADLYFEKLLTKHAKHRLSDDASTYLVRHALNKDRDQGQLIGKDGLKKAIQYVKLAIKAQPQGDMSSESLSFAFTEAMRRNDLNSARQLLALGKTITHLEFQDHEAGRLLYWEGRLLALDLKHAQAKKKYREVLNSAPMTWYALMAYNRLYEYSKKEADQAYQAWLKHQEHKLSWPAMNHKHWHFKFPNDSKQKIIQKAIFWSQAQMYKHFKKVMDELTEAPELQKLRADFLLFETWVLDRLGDYPSSHNIMRRQLWEFRMVSPQGNGLKYWHLAYPNPFKETVKKAHDETKVEMAFIWGIMREESGFTKEIKSHANAYGLLQLILPTAQSMKKPKEKAVTAKTLSDPEVNIPLGARYLANVKEKCECHWALVPAGYNAGGGALNKWIKERGDLPLDLFVETIPYEEARWYLKRVNSSWITYRTLYGNLKEPWPIVPQKIR
jgi:soluble lytic murein transglycosylase